VPDADASRIVDEARAAPLVVLRGRTDGSAESPAESAIARQRAAAVEAWLVQAGVDRGRIRTTWQPVGDHAADNTTAGGRTLNRRVEIEIYRAAPVVAVAGSLDAATAQRSGD
jgi:outer membrane protein OmpA-like peptidoglycan-associated protein